MHPKLLDYYNRELGHVRDMAAEFAREFPKVAGRLGIEGLEVADPYVERLIEGFAFIAARIQLKLDAEFPRFTQHLLEMVYPHYLAPMPCLAIVQMHPNLADGGLAAGVEVPRGSVLRGVVARGEQTACEFRTTQPVRLLPLDIVGCRYFVHAPDLPLAQARTREPVRAGLRVRLRCAAGLGFARIDCGAPTFFIDAPDDVAIPLYELLVAQCTGVLVTDGGPQPRLLGQLDARCIVETAFDEANALLPSPVQSFGGYRLLQEYFALPQRFLFLSLEGLAPLLAGHTGDELELVFLFARNHASLEPVVETGTLCLHATPAINLFERRADRVQVGEGEFEHHLVIDRARPADFEVFGITRVRGFGIAEREEQEFLPFYAGFDAGPRAGGNAYYSMRREPRLMPGGNGRTRHAGSDVFLSLVDPREAPYAGSISQLAVDVLATNRDLPLLLPVAAANIFTLQQSAPVSRVTVRRGPTRPRAAFAEGEYAWRLIDHLSLNYLSLIQAGADGKGAGALRDLLSLYADQADAGLRKQIDALSAVSSRPVVRRLPIAGPIAFGRGIQIDLHLDEAPFAGAGGFLFGSVLERFLARYVSINAFTQTRLISPTRAQVHQWPARIGARTLL